MAPRLSGEDLAFHGAYMSYKRAQTTEERSAASLRLRAELERKSVSLEEALKREKAARTEDFQQEVALLEERLGKDLKAKDDAAAVKKAVMELCLEKMEAEPLEAALYFNIVLSWATKPKIEPTKSKIEPTNSSSNPLPPDSCMDGYLDKLREEMLVSSKMEFMGPSRRVVIHISKMTPQQLYRVSSDVQRILKNKGTFVPVQDLSGAISESVKIEKERISRLKLFKEAAGWVSVGFTVVGGALTTVEAIKNLPMNKDCDGEPLLNCRHYLPDGWFF